MSCSSARRFRGLGSTALRPGVGRRSLLVLGSSLKVMSGYRFVLHARKLGIPVAIVNQGATRGDPQADLKIDAELRSATLTD